jgi:hypothetical protein
MRHARIPHHPLPNPDQASGHACECTSITIDLEETRKIREKRREE